MSPAPRRLHVGSRERGGIGQRTGALDVHAAGLRDVANRVAVGSSDSDDGRRFGPIKRGPGASSGSNTKTRRPLPARGRIRAPHDVSSTRRRPATGGTPSGERTKTSRRRAVGGRGEHSAARVERAISAGADGLRGADGSPPVSRRRGPRPAHSAPRRQRCCGSATANSTTCSAPTATAREECQGDQAPRSTICPSHKVASSSRRRQQDRAAITMVDEQFPELPARLPAPWWARRGTARSGSPQAQATARRCFCPRTAPHQLARSTQARQAPSSTLRRG
jgi:hypothetical protein